MRRGHPTLAAFGLGVRRVVGRLRGPTPGRTLVCVSGVAAAVALLFIVTGLSLGLAAGATVDSDGVDYWIVPGGGDGGSVPLDAEGTRLSEVHGVTAELRGDDRIEYATPVALQPLRIHNPDTDERMYVLAVGVIPPDGDRSVAELDVSALSSAYPHRADGSYDGEWTGEAVVTPGVAERLERGDGDRIDIGGSDRQLTVVAVNDEELTAGFGEVPAVAMPLAELQSTTGLHEADRADQILVAATDPEVRSELESIYPGTRVVSRAGLTGVEATPTNLPFAMALSAALVAGGIGIAFVGTMMGLELTAGRRELAVLDAIGFTRSRMAVVVVAETLTVAALGGIVGVAVGLGGALALEAGVASAVGLPALVEIRPWLVGYAFAAALAVGLCAAPYPLYLALGTNTLEELTR